MRIAAVDQQVLNSVPGGEVAAGSAAAAPRRIPVARDAHAERDARRRRGEQAALAASILKLTGRRR
jgi:hypothetical protein